MINVVFFDIDWTLLSHKQGRIPKSAVKTIKKLQTCGIKCVAATGRNCYELKSLPIKDVNFDATIALNGQIIFDKNGKTIKKRSIKDTKQLHKIFNEKQLPIMFVEDDLAYVNIQTDYVIKSMQEISTAVPPVMELRDNEILQAVLFADEKEAPKHESKFPGFSFLRWHPYAVDIVLEGVDKVVGVQDYCRHTGITQDQTMAFGDGDNDVKMLEWCKIGVAMGNANDAVKKAAKFITKDIEDDGLAYAIEQLNKFFN